MAMMQPNGQVFNSPRQESPSAELPLSAFPQLIRHTEQRMATQGVVHINVRMVEIFILIARHP